jgi:flagellar hook-basal body complex protein FliE
MAIEDLMNIAGQFNPLQQQRLNPGGTTGINPANPGRVQQPRISGMNDVSFVDTLKEFIGDVNSAQKESSEYTEKFIKGEPVELHDVMISAEKAKTTFQLLMELRNKGLDMYREVIRIPI